MPAEHIDKAMTRMAMRAYLLDVQAQRRMAVEKERRRVRLPLRWFLAGVLAAHVVLAAIEALMGR